MASPSSSRIIARPRITTVAELREQIAAWQANGETICLVPTMGSLHRGHLSLVELAGKTGDRTVVSIFVNPAQFAPHEDFDSYPPFRRTSFFPARFCWGLVLVAHK